MLDDIADRHPFLDRNGNSLELDRIVAFDQYGTGHKPPFVDLASIVIISAERGSDTKKCVESIFKTTPEPFEIILSDVGSSRETLEIIMALEDLHKNIHVIYNKQSTGTTGQRNQGIYFSRGDHLVLMDNDVLVLPEWLKHLKETAAKDEKIGMVGAKLLKPDVSNVYYCGCHAITLEKDGKVYGIGLTKSGKMANLNRYDPLVMLGGEVPWYTTTALLAKRNVLFESGGFDDVEGGKGIFIANEDKDLSLSIRKTGYKIHYCPYAEAIHNHDYSNVDRHDTYHSEYRLRMEQIEKDTAYFVSKWNIKYMIEILPHEDNTKEWCGNNCPEQLSKGIQRLRPVKLDLASSELNRDIVSVRTLHP
jgi:GT2 family glycosyltransferase